MGVTELSQIVTNVLNTKLLNASNFLKIKNDILNALNVHMESRKSYVEKEMIRLHKGRTDGKKQIQDTICEDDGEAADDINGNEEEEEEDHFE